MAVRKIKPVTPGQRHKIVSTFDTLTSAVPEKSLLEPLRKSGGRNVRGKKNNEIHWWRSQTDVSCNRFPEK